MALTGKKAELAALLFDLGAVKFGEFELKMHEGMEKPPKSPIYLDLRTEKHPTKPGPLTDEAMERIGDLFLELLEQTEVDVFECFTDIPDAGAPFGDQLERVLEFTEVKANRLTLHKEQLEGGKRRITEQVDGDYEFGDNCLLVDDLVTGADTKLEAITALEGRGLQVVDILAVVDRLQGGTQRLGQEGYDVHVIFRLDQLLDFYVETGRLAQMKAIAVMDYIRANQVH